MPCFRRRPLWSDAFCKYSFRSEIYKCADSGYLRCFDGYFILYDICIYPQFLDACHFPCPCGFASLLSTGIFDAGNIVSQINTFSAINSLSFIMLAIPMFVMLRKSRRIRLEMLYNNVPIYDDEHEAKMLSIVSLVLGIISLVLSCIGYLIGLGIVGIFAAISSKKANHIITLWLLPE